MAQMATTEDQIIIRHTEEWFKATSWNINQFAEKRIIEALEAEQPESERFDEKTASAKEYKSWITKKKQQVVRALDGTTSFPLHWKWLWIACLDEPYRSRCRADLLALAGVMDIPLPSSAIPQSPAGSPVRANVADLMREVADVLEAASPAHDGVYSFDDDGEASDRMCDELLDVINACTREVAAIQAGTGRSGNRTRLGKETALMMARISKQINK